MSVAPIRSPRRALSLLCCACLTDVAAHAGFNPNGVDFQANSYTTGGQGNPAVVSLADGSFVTVWQSAGSAGTDTADSSVQARRFSAGGAPLGADFQVNSYTFFDQSGPDAVATPSGGFVVVWAVSASGADSIRAQRHAAGGAPLGGEIVVNSYFTAEQSLPAVGIDEQGRFVVVWQSDASPADDLDSWSIQARRFAADGSPFGPQFQVNQYTTDAQERPALAVAPGGGFVVSWQSLGSSDGDASGTSVQARLFASDGTPVADQFQANSYTTGGQGFPVAGIDSIGRFVVAWSSYGSAGSDTSLSSIQARRFDADGTASGAELQVNAYTSNAQTQPAIRVGPAGDFVVAWSSYGSSESDQDRHSIQARSFDSSGAPRGSQLQVNSYTTGIQQFPAFALDSSGNLLFSWLSAGSGGTDSSGFSIQARRFDALFRDGFEVGHAGRWSTAVP